MNGLPDMLNFFFYSFVGSSVLNVGHDRDVTK